MMREWQPGDVASVLFDGMQAAFRTTKGWTFIDGSTSGENGDGYGFRPLVVIDPEDREQVERLTKAIFVALPLADVPNQESGRAPYWYEALPFAMQTALRSLLAPPKPEVYSHLVVDKADALKESVCGKVWRPDHDVTVVGKCPDCLSIADDEEWTA